MWCASKRKREFTRVEEADSVERVVRLVPSLFFRTSSIVRGAVFSDQCYLVMHVKIGFGIVSLGNTNQVYSRVACIRNIRRLFFSRNFFNEFVIRICIIFNSLRPFLREEFRETNLSNLHLILILITFVCLGNFECSSEYELVSMKFHTFICLSSVTIYLWPW